VGEDEDENEDEDDPEGISMWRMMRMTIRMMRCG